MVLIRIFLIAALVACPFRCMGSLAVEQAGSTGAGAFCACCPSGRPVDTAEPQSGQESSSESSPVEMPADQDCGCGTCLCRGAVVESDWLDAVPSDGDLHPLAAIVADDAPSASGAPACGWLTDLPPTLATGRSVRVLHQSFLL